MKLGLQISSFSWPGGDAAIGPTLGRIARLADEVGFDSIWVMDHFFQIRSIGRPEEPMLEGFTTLGYLAALTQRARLGPDGRRHPLPPARPVAEGRHHARRAVRRARLVRHRRGLERGGEQGAGLPDAAARGAFRAARGDAPLRARRLDRARPARGARSGAARVEASRLLNAPQALSRPHPPILVGGGGELKTLKLVARYADACNVFGSPDQVRHKYAVLREHCEREGRDYDTIEKTNLSSISITADGARGSMTPTGLVERLGGWAEAGSMHTIVSIRNAWDLSKLELIGRDVLPQIRGLGEPSPLD